MSSPDRSRYARRRRVDPGTADRARLLLVGVFLVGRVLDSVTTAIGLAYVPGIVEQNPALVAVIDTIGLPSGLFVTNVVVVVLVLVSVEGGCVVLRSLPRDTRWPRLGVRLLGYVPLAVTGLITAVHNTLLILRVHDALFVLP